MPALLRLHIIAGASDGTVVSAISHFSPERPRKLEDHVLLSVKNASTNSFFLNELVLCYRSAKSLKRRKVKSVWLRLLTGLELSGI